MVKRRWADDECAWWGRDVCCMATLVCGLLTSIDACIYIIHLLFLLCLCKIWFRCSPLLTHHSLIPSLCCMLVPNGFTRRRPLPDLLHSTSVLPLRPPVRTHYGQKFLLLLFPLHCIMLLHLLRTGSPHAPAAHRDLHSSHKQVTASFQSPQ